MSQDLTAQRPALRAFRGIGTQHVGEPVLLALSLPQVIFKLLGDRLSRGASVAGVGRALAGRRVGLQDLTVRPDRGG